MKKGVVGLLCLDTTPTILATMSPFFLVGDVGDVLIPHLMGLSLSRARLSVSCPPVRDHPHEVQYV